MAATSADDGGTAVRRFMLGGGLLGFALGGFFDGIILHQVLQWHHLLSLVPGETWRDPRMQILVDGLFHVFHYAVALAGLWLLWRNRAAAAGAGLGRRLLGAALIGFGLWQVVDAVAFHWVLGIHRIRVDVPNPLTYDIGWLVAFGATALLAGFVLRRSTGGGAAGPAARGLAAAVLLAGPAASLPPRVDGPQATMVLFRPGIGAPAAFAAVAAAGGRVLWADPSGELLAVVDGTSGMTWQLFRRGALLVGSAPGPLGGCLRWADAPAPSKT